MPSISSILSSLNDEHRLRSIPAFTTDKPLLDMSSNDYMSLGARCGEFKEEFLVRFHDAEFSSSASRLLSTKQKYHYLLEEYLRQLYGKPALLFNSGYHANVGCVGALTLPSTLFVCDKLIHASIVDGLRIAGSDFKRFPHNDMEKLDAIIRKESSNYERIVIVVESIYSMDGDVAPLRQIVDMKRSSANILLYVDEAHAFGVRGERGLGLAEEYGLTEDIDLLIGTFGKAAASAGAFAVCSEELKSFLINTARPFIFSTALPPANTAWSLLMTEKLTLMQRQRKHLREIGEYFNQRLARILGHPTGSTSQIVPFLTGDSLKALGIAAKLGEMGVLALPIRRPTVPPGGERIRFSLATDMTTENLDFVCNILEEIQR